MKYNPEDHLRLVGKIAGQYAKNSRMEYEDIFQEGCIGLVRACNEYEEGDVPFGAFAAMHIRFDILTALRNYNFLKVDRDTVYLAAKIIKKGLENASIEELSREFEVTEKAAIYAKGHIKNEIMSLEFQYKTKANSEPVTLLDKLGNKVNFEDDLLINETIEKLRLKESDKEILKIMTKGYTLKDSCVILGENEKNFAARIRSYRIKNKEIPKI